MPCQSACKPSAPKLAPGNRPMSSTSFDLWPRGQRDCRTKPRADVEIDVNGNTPAPAPVVIQQQYAVPDLHGDLLKLEDLRKRGLFTDAEFDAQKAKLLAR